MTTAFVAGSTGHTGRAVVDALVAHGCTTVAHVRPDSSALSRWRAAWEPGGVVVDTTEWDEAAMTQTLRTLAPTHVFALLGTTRKRAGRDGMSALEAYERVDYGLTALLLEAAQACGSAPRFVYLSVAAVSETTRNPYMKVRVRIERALRASPLPTLVGRPSIIVGERDEARTAERWGATLLDGALAAAGALGAKKTAERYRSTTNLALAAGLVRIALDPSTPHHHIAEAEDLRHDAAQPRQAY